MNGAKDLVECINEIVASGKVELPVYKMRDVRFQEELARSDADSRKIENLINLDQTLAANVLRMANSAFYHGLHKVSSIRDAVLRLGTLEVSNILVLASQKQAFHAKDPFINGILDVLWHHSVACAVGSQYLARCCNYRKILQESFLAGLLHDIGKLLLLTIIEKCKMTGMLKFQPNEAIVSQCLADLHADYGHTLLKKWELPDNLCQVAQNHHKEKYTSDNELLILVRMADKACRKVGIGLEKDSSIVLSACEEARSLGLSEFAVAELQLKIEDSLKLAG